MGQKKLIKKSIFSFISLFFVLLNIFLNVSCSDSEPKLTAVSPCLVFDYADEKSEPEIRLSVFATAESDVRRAVEVRAVSQKTGLEWVCREPIKLSDGSKKNWVGYTNFTAAYGQTIPDGKYFFFYEDAAGKEYELDFYLTFDQKYFTAKSGDFPDIIKTSKSKKIALYNQEDCLLYFGEFKKAWKDVNDATKSYSDAIKYRICYSTTDNKLCFLMPFAPLEKRTESKSEENNNENVVTRSPVINAGDAH